ncbi:MAG TPA: heparan-alpha-glucosaminide N-acetyltransferase [Bauldia sp.]
MAVSDTDSGQTSPDRAAPPGRLAAIDLLRGIAVVAMVVYHTAFDLFADRLIAVDVIDDFGWKIFARAIASTFLTLVGIGLVLSTRNGFRRDTYLRRLGLIVGGAALVSLGTWWFDPPTFVFFGILHEIAVASVLALPFLWLPIWLTAIASVVAIAVPFLVAAPVFNAPALWWVGLSTVEPVTVDYVPVLPWFGVVLAGVVVGHLLLSYGGKLWRWHPGNLVARGLMAAGRWSLAVYLIHQPLIVGLLYVVVLLLPPPSKEFVRENFVGQCVSACKTDGDSAKLCNSFCGCMFDRLYGTDLFTVKSIADMSPDQRHRWNDTIDACQSGAPDP